MTQKDKLLLFLYLLKMMGEVCNNKCDVVCLKKKSGYDCDFCVERRKVLFRISGVSKKTINKYHLGHDSPCYVDNYSSGEFLKKNKHVVPELDKYALILFCMKEL